MRKFYIILSILIALAMVLSACGGGDATPAAEEPVAEEPAEEEVVEEEPADASEGIQAGESETEEEAVEVSQYNEAPSLADKVAAGELPSVDERLPVNPMVLTPNAAYDQTIGVYGGNINTVTDNPDMSNIKMWLYDPPIRWKADLTGYQPGMAASYEWSDDAQTFTLHFREGLKWSDGEPFTMEDLEFWWIDMATNKDVGFVTVPWYLWNTDTRDADGALTPCDVTFPTDYDMTWVCDHPIPVAPYILAQGFWEWEPLITPKHYLKDFHPTYNADATFEGLEQARKWWLNPDMPTMMAWHLDQVETGQWFKFSRNPFYWKVDSEGNQLPYVDTLFVEVVEDAEIRTLNLSQGKYDISFRGPGNRALDWPFLYEQQEAGDYTLYDGWMNGAGAYPGLLVNMDYTGGHAEEGLTDVDIEIRDLLRNKWFRRAISVAMDREKIIDVVWDGVGEPINATISPQSWHFASEQGQEVFEEWAYMYTDYDPAQAAAWLDEIGMVDADGDGWRDLPSGETFQLVIDETCWAGQPVEDRAMPLVEEFLEADPVKIDTLINMICNTPDVAIRHEETAEMMIRTAHISEVDIWTYPDWVFPLRKNRNWPMQGKFRETGGEKGWDPYGENADGNAAKLQEIYDAAMVEPDTEKRHELFWQAITEVHIEEGPFDIGLAGDQPEPVIVKNGYHNVQNYGVLGPWAPATPGNTFPELWFYEK
ncbi:MAG: hypothetical protein JW750_12845 [Anaerolineaceae bacterium]|nr:hypothetical protein [Anaerolineaceae bacterium]